MLVGSVAVDSFCSVLEDIDSLVAEVEDGEAWYFELLRPEKLPNCLWI